MANWDRSSSLIFSAKSALFKTSNSTILRTDNIFLETSFTAFWFKILPMLVKMRNVTEGKMLEISPGNPNPCQTMFLKLKECGDPNIILRKLIQGIPSSWSSSDLFKRSLRRAGTFTEPSTDKSKFPKDLSRIGVSNSKI